jgi:hypothetical protein
MLDGREMAISGTVGKLKKLGSELDWNVTVIYSSDPRGGGKGNVFNH